ncbi:polysaccharide deacetylase family protein [Nonomuraea sp. NPDC050536]|uniref:polysaccharide deacetylase family protein n=1 Tax=Nonomuraea sp. NPDC050536 TaxID=3364366 RepID=UPI0037C5C6E1
MCKRRFFGGIATLALTLAACGVATASPERDVTVPADPTMIDFVDPAKVGGLVTRSLTEGESGGRQVHVAYPEFKAAPKLNEVVGKEAERQLRDFKRSTSTGGLKPRPELNMEWALDAATDDLIGVRLRTGEFLGANWGNSTITFWYDKRSDEAFTSTGLLDGDKGLHGVAELVREQLIKRGPEVDQNEVTASRDLFNSLAFNRAGDLVVEFDDCQVGPCSLGRVAVAVPARRVEPLLSPAGRRAQHLVRETALVAPLVTPRVSVTRNPDAASQDAGSVDCKARKCVALTFDDGPGPYTARLLDILQEFDARATFFTLGANASTDPAILRRMSREGHLVANHSWAHRDLTKLSSSKIADTLGRTRDTITSAIGQTPTLVRPPYGGVNADVRTTARRLGVALVNWDVDTLDWRDRDPEVIARRAVHGAHRGAIILLHDIQRTTVDAVPDILNKLRGKGYAFVTVPELYGAAGMRPGYVYTSGAVSAP